MKCIINSLVTFEMSAAPLANQENFYIRSQVFQDKILINQSPVN